MRLNFADQRVLAVVAHPDDAELLCAGTLARARDDGAAIGVCVLCAGDRGQPREPIDNLAAVRAQEMIEAASLLGAELVIAGCPDGTLTDDPATRERVVESFRLFRPTLVLGHAAEDYHADHRATAALVDSASWMSASAGLRTASPPLDTPPAVWWMDTLGMHRFEPTLYVDVSSYLPLKERMLGCHRSQLARGDDSDFPPLLEQLRIQAAARGRQAGVAAAEAFRVHHTFGRCRAW
ncbi:MAG: PIG-L deacetylase family protein [Planctomycetaceae bacterium]